MSGGGFAETGSGLHPEYREERLADLETHFAGAGLGKPSDTVSKIELYQFLDTRAGTQFDREVADDLFVRADSDGDLLVTFEQFALVFVEAEERLSKKIADYRDKITELENCVLKTQNQLVEAEMAEDGADCKP